MIASSVGFELEVGTSGAEPAVRTAPGMEGSLTQYQQRLEWKDRLRHLG